MITRSLCGISIVAMLMAECLPGPETREAVLDVVATDLTGERIYDIEVELFDVTGRVAEITAKSTRVRARYGDYRLRVYSPGFHSAWRDIRIYQPEKVVQIELRHGAIGCPDPPAEIGGRVLQRGKSSELWVKAVPIRGTGGGEARVSEYGYFLIGGLERSTYLVVVLRGERPVFQQVVKTYPGDASKSNLTIKLDPGV